MFEGKNVIITGAGRGIGRTLALGFARHRAMVVVHYAHSKQGAEDVVKQIVSEGGRAIAVQADLHHPEEIARLVQEVHERVGLIDVWINNAGASANTKETREMDEIAVFRRLVEVDLLGTWWCCRQVRPFMREGGCILTTGWDHALDGAAGVVNQLYAMSKGAILSLTRCLALEYAPHVRVNCIAPGHIENDWSQSLPEASHTRIIQHTPLQRWGTAEDILSTALFLSSPAASFITGQVILVDGGEVMR